MEEFECKTGADRLEELLWRVMGGLIWRVMKRSHGIFYGANIKRRVQERDVEKY